MDENLYTIEINLDDDFANACAYHIDSFKNTSAMNLRHAVEMVKGDRWVTVGLAYSLSEASEKAHKLRAELCRRHKRTPYGIDELLQKMAEGNESKGD